MVRTVDELLETCTDRQVAARLNELGYRNWRGQSFTAKKVIVIRMAYRLKSRFERLRGRGMLTGDEIAKKIGVCATTVHEWGRTGLVERDHSVEYGAVIIKRHHDAPTPSMISTPGQTCIRHRAQFDLGVKIDLLDFAAGREVRDARAVKRNGEMRAIPSGVIGSPSAVSRRPGSPPAASCGS